jgi:hypothetical protein
MYISNAGTCTSLKLRGHTKPSYSVIEYDKGQVRIHRKYPFGPSTLIAHWNPRTGEQYHREFEPLFSAPIPPVEREHDTTVPPEGMPVADTEAGVADVTAGG